jgi:hypothetical protein
MTTLAIVEAAPHRSLHHTNDKARARSRESGYRP